MKTTFISILAALITSNLCLGQVRLPHAQLGFTDRSIVSVYFENEDRNSRIIGDSELCATLNFPSSFTFSSLTRDSTTSFRVDRFKLYHNHIEIVGGFATVFYAGKHPKYALASRFDIPEEMPHDSIGLLRANDIAISDAIHELLGASLKSQVGADLIVKANKGLVLIRRQDNISKLRYAYNIEVCNRDMSIRYNYYIDLVNGSVLLRDNMIRDVNGSGKSLYSGIVPLNIFADSSGSYVLHDTDNAYIYTYTRDSTQNLQKEVSSRNGYFTEDAAVDAHWGALQVYNYWKMVHNRLSYDGNNSPIINYVHYKTNYDNAFWNGSFMTYGDGSGIERGGYKPFVSLDICGHEIGHGVCEHTCGLVYAKESGAMNEGFSDIWGACVENFYISSSSTAGLKNTWEIGEQIGAVPIRSMANPKQYGLPDTYKGKNWYALDGCTPSANNDQCGVHTNMGVITHWFYLLSEGGSGVNDFGQRYRVSGIGILKASSIAYATELMLSSTADYTQCMETSILAAKGIFGDCSSEAEMTARAWYACGLGTNPLSCSPTISFTSASETFEMYPSAQCNDTMLLSLPVVIDGVDSLQGGLAIVSVTDSAENTPFLSFELLTRTISFHRSNDTQYIALLVTTHSPFAGQKSVRLKLSMENNSTNADASAFNFMDVNIVSQKKNIDTGGISQMRIAEPNIDLIINSPFTAAAKIARNQIVYTAAELRKAGLRKGIPITRLGFRLVRKRSLSPYQNYNFNFCFGDSFTLSEGWLPPSLPWVKSYEGEINLDTGLIWIAMPANTLWDGHSDLALQSCFSDTTLVAENDVVEGYTYGSGQNAYSNSTYNLIEGCSLTYVAQNVSTFKPVLYIALQLPATRVAHSGTSGSMKLVHNESASLWIDDSLIACTLIDSQQDLNCIQASIATFCFDQRCQKSFQFNLSSATGAPNGLHAKLFYSDSELTGLDTEKLYLIQTSANVGEEMSAANTVSLPVHLSKDGDLRYVDVPIYQLQNIFLSDSDPFGHLRQNTFMVENPFTTEINISYLTTMCGLARIHLYDLVGKKVLETTREIGSGKGAIKIDSLNNLPKGIYIISLQEDFELYTFKLIKL